MTVDQRLSDHLPSITIQIAHRFRGEIDESGLHRVAAEVLRLEEVAEGTELSLIITDDEEIRKLNRRFRGVDAPTDVLAFGGGADEQLASIPEIPPYLGDVVISYQRALAQAGELGHAAAEELGLLVIHGILHLLGYDHQEEAAARQMWQREERIWSDGQVISGELVEAPDQGLSDHPTT